MKQNGFSQVLIILLILIGLALGLYLIQNSQVFKSKASSSSILIKNSSGEDLPKEGDLPITTSLDIKIRLDAPGVTN